MKKIIVLAVITGSILIISAIGLAQNEQPQKGKMGQMGQMMDQKMKKQDHMQTRCPACAMAMCGMMSKAMLPTDDGGIVVMIGNKLYKYDQNLDLQKETELSVDFKNMKQMMMKMHSMDQDSQNGDKTQSESQP
jgi:hypothetical protein